ncbi:MAG: hypothetical protein AB7H96_03560 [Vicinamibacterales bacterium]
MLCDSPPCPVLRLNGPERPDEPGDGDDDTPETPLDEPPPPRVEDPPSEPDQKGPYVVNAW